MLDLQARPRSYLIEYLVDHAIQIPVVGGVVLIAYIFFGRNGPIPYETIVVVSLGFLLLLAIAIIIRSRLRATWPYRIVLGDECLEFLPVTDKRSRSWPWRKFFRVMLWKSSLGSPCIRLLTRGLTGFITGGIFIDLNTSSAQAGIVARAIENRIRT